MTAAADEQENTSASSGQTASTIAELVPGISIPGLSNIDFGRFTDLDTYSLASGPVKGVLTSISVFKFNDLTYVAGAFESAVPVSSFIPGTGGTPLEGLNFNNMVFAWVPTSGAATLGSNDLTPKIAGQAAKSGASFDLVEGINVIAEIAIDSDSDLGSLLSTVGIMTNSVNIVGALPPAVFQNLDSVGADIESQILANINLSVPLPNIAIPGLPDITNFQSTALAIKGGTSGLEVDVAGVLDVDAQGSDLVFNYDVEFTEKADGTTDSRRK